MNYSSKVNVERLPADLNVGVFEDLPKGRKILADVLNDKLKIIDVINMFKKNGIEKGATHQNISYHVRRIKKEIGFKKDGNITYQHYDGGNPQSENRVDPILGLHGIIKELEATSKDGLSFTEYIKTISVRASTYEKIFKLDNKSQNQVERSQLVQKLDNLSLFSYILHESFEEMGDEIHSILDSIITEENRDKIERVYAVIEQKINIKQRYLDYTDTIDVTETDMDSVASSEVLE